MRYILIPVKDLARTKQRLAALMTQEERMRLAWAMLERTFASSVEASLVDRIAVVTNYAPAIKLAARYGMEVIAEKEQISESISVDFASRELEQRGARAILRLPIDLPLVAPEDINAIFIHDVEASSVVIVPSRNRDGTNAILRRPGTLFPSHFGPGSFAKHIAEARSAQTHCKILHLPRIALDVDDSEDLAELIRQGQGTSAYELLMEMRTVARLKLCQ